VAPALLSTEVSEHEVTWFGLGKGEKKEETQRDTTLGSFGAYSEKPNVEGVEKEGGDYLIKLKAWDGLSPGAVVGRRAGKHKKSKNSGEEKGKRGGCE